MDGTSASVAGQESWDGSILDLPQQPIGPTDDRPVEAVNDLLKGNAGLPDSITALIDSLGVMQSHFYELWQGTWPDAIDWTRAVMGTQISATLHALTSYPEYSATRDYSGDRDTSVGENLINRYFTHLTSFYFGENAFDLRTQAYDDMLWVVLGWLESIKFINLHSDLHHSASHGNSTSSWYGRQFIPSFAHRARLFYDLASHGWDTSLCGGGMLWSPYLAPYKNAITNQLFITASISMYLNFPGDENTSPFIMKTPREAQNEEIPPAKAHDEKYLTAAVNAYKWLKTSNMTNSKGLYTDGFHIQGWRGGGPNGSIGSGRCDVRDEQVYTYNQGVLLSGLRGLWTATGTQEYLEDGHALIRNVIAATGWHHGSSEPRSEQRWAGIGQNGILEEACDAYGDCSQNGQTFKGIFFHHLSVFCKALPVEPPGDDDVIMDVKTESITWKANKELAGLHRRSCLEYRPWVQRNAEAAYGTRDENGEYGMWWGRRRRRDGGREDGANEGREEGTDYRNYGVPMDNVWRLPGFATKEKAEGPENGREYAERRRENKHGDWNDRGRGRTVETQSGGLAVLRALYLLEGLD